jgi:hypothetical protein
MSEQVPNPMESSVENPMLPDEPPTRVEPAAETEPRPSELESELANLEQQDVTAPGPGAKGDWPVAIKGDDEGPLGEGGQLRGPGASSGSGS